MLKKNNKQKFGEKCKFETFILSYRILCSNYVNVRFQYLDISTSIRNKRPQIQILVAKIFFKMKYNFKNFSQNFLSFFK